MGQDKLWIDVGGRPLIAHAITAAADAACFDAVCIAAPRDRWDALRDLTASRFASVLLVEGGARRQDSVRAALDACIAHEVVCVHDAARPLAPPRLFNDVVAAARATGAATTAVTLVDAVKRAQDGVVIETLRREGLVAAQTPQAFRTELLRRAHAEARDGGALVDDDAALVELLGERVAVVDGDRRNLKVTHADDLALLRALLQDPS